MAEGGGVMRAEDVISELKERARSTTSIDLARIFESAVEMLEASLKDTERLDYLDECNHRLNLECGSVYRWEFVQSHLVNRLMCGSLNRVNGGVDLNDQSSTGTPSCREAIDAAIEKSRK